MKRPPAPPPAAPGPPPAGPCRVWIIEDHVSIRQLLEAFVAATPGFQVVGSGEAAAPAVTAARQGLVELVILDLGIPGDGGMVVLQELRQASAATRVVIYSATATAHSLQMAINHGALGYVDKSDPILELRTAMERAKSGGTHFSPRPSRVLASLMQATGSGFERPGREELQILELLARGNSVKAIAHELQVSGQKVYRIRQGLMERARARNPQDLVRYAIEIGVLGAQR